MITKTDYALHLINEFIREEFKVDATEERSENSEIYCKYFKSVNDFTKEDIAYLNSMIFTSSRMAIALEFLGLLDNINKEYVASRGGLEILHILGTNEVSHILSVREMFDLLPDEI